MSDVIQKKKLAKALTKIEKCSLGKWYTGRTDGKTEEVVLMEDVESIILELLNEPTTKNDLGVDAISRAQTQTEIEMNASRYTIAKERCGMSQVEWSDQLIKVSDAVDIIRNLPQVTPQEPRWIPVSEKLPTKEEYIANNGLFIVSDGNRTYAEYFDVYNSMKYFGEPTMNGFRVDSCVIAWMPLPKAYREVVEE